MYGLSDSLHNNGRTLSYNWFLDPVASLPVSASLGDERTLRGEYLQRLRTVYGLCNFLHGNGRTLCYTVNTCVELKIMPYTVLRQPSAGVVSCTAHHGLDLEASVGDTVNCLFVANICTAFSSPGLVHTICLVLLVNFLAPQELTGYARTVVALLFTHGSWMSSFSATQATICCSVY